MIVILNCIRKRVSRASKCSSSRPSIQQVWTYLKQSRSTKRIKAKLGVHLNSVQAYIILAMIQLHALLTEIKYILHAQPVRMMRVYFILLYLQ